MRVGVISDTHGRVGRTEQAVELLRQHRVDMVLHCGDIGSAEIPQLFREWPTHFVLGNVDRDEALLRTAIAAAGLCCHGQFGSVECGGAKIAFLHGHDARRLEATIAAGRWDLVCFGHTHRAESWLQGGTLVVNPGAVHRARPPSCAVIQLPGRIVQDIRW